MNFNCLVGIALCVLLGGCDQAALMRKWTPPESESIARNYVDLLRQGKFEQIERDLDPSVMDSNVGGTFTRMAAMFPAEAPESIRVVGAHVLHRQESVITDIMLEYKFPNKWLLVNITTRRAGNVSTIAGFHVEPLRDSLENLNRFTLVGRNTDQYLLLMVAVGSLLFSLYIFVLCIRTKNEKRKWLWMLFILIGVGKLAVNWTTGQWNVTFWAFQIPCGMATAPLYGPWTIAASAPLGALLYFIRHGKIKTAGESIPQSVNRSD